jgi:hypothetical protein
VQYRRQHVVVAFHGGYVRLDEFELSNREFIGVEHGRRHPTGRQMVKHILAGASAHITNIK